MENPCTELLTNVDRAWARQTETGQGLLDLVSTISRSGNPDEPFWYLGGPMTGLPQFNFPAFKAAANQLRADDHNIISPAELDDPEAEAKALSSEDGAKDSAGLWADYLSRDIIICSLPNCLGGIFLPGWHNSAGALLESFVLDRLGRKLYEFLEPVDQPTAPAYYLKPLDREARLLELLANSGGFT
jgi:hypothetical protein